MIYKQKLQYLAISCFSVLTFSSCGTIGQEALESLKSGFTDSSTASTSYENTGSQWVQLVSDKKPTVFVASLKEIKDDFFKFPIDMPQEYRSQLYKDNQRFKDYINNYSSDISEFSEFKGHDVEMLKSYNKKTGQLFMKRRPFPMQNQKEYISVVKSSINRSLIDSRRLTITENASTADYLLNVEVAWSYFDYESLRTTYKDAEGNNKTTHNFNVYSCYHFILHFVSVKTQKEIMKTTYNYIFKGRDSHDIYNYFNGSIKYVYAIKDKAALLPLVNQVFPIITSISSINETDNKGKIKKVTINVGNNLGVKNKMRFGVFSEIDVAGESIMKEVAELEVEQVFDNTALCKVKKGNDKIDDDVVVLSKSIQGYNVKPYDLMN